MKNKCRGWLFAWGLVLLSGPLGTSSAQADGAGITKPSEIFTQSPSQQQAMLVHAWTKAWQMPGVVTGPKKGPAIVVFFDPNCPYCAHLWHRLQAWRNQLRVKWVPIAFIRSSSLKIAVRVLSSKNPRNALDYNEGHYHFKTHRGGVLPAFHVSPEQSAVIERNTAFWRKRFGVTPTILYPIPSGGIYCLYSLPSMHDLQVVYHDSNYVYHYLKEMRHEAVK